MGRKKPFIDKSKATTYHVMYKEHDDAEDPFEFVSAADMQQRVEEAAEANSARHPLAFLYEDEDDHVQTEEQRQEILGMGLPDDGYNYLKHMRAPGARTQMMIVPNATGESSTDVNPEEQKASASGEQVFVPPEEDVRFFDASALPASSTDEKQEAADGRQVTVSAFSRPIHHIDKVSKLTSIAEVTAMMEALDEDDAMFLEVEGCAPEPILGDGDLLDDFVESAQQAELVEDDRYGPEVLAEAGTIAWDLDDANASEASGDEQGVPRRTPASIADSFWRKEREDRTDAQTVMDERLIARMDLEYGDDDIGSLEDDEEATRSHRAWDTEDARLQKVLLAYGQRGQDEHARSMGESAQLRSGAGTNGGAESLEYPEDDERIARAKALEAAEQYCSLAGDSEADSTESDALIAGMLAPRRVADDCQSILSSCSNVYNHPRQICDEQRQQKRKPVSSSDVRVSGAGMVQLSSKTGLPIGVSMGLPGVIEEGSESDAESEQSEVRVNLGKARGKGETAAEKKARKAAVKEAKRIARQRKKESKQVFAEANTSMQQHVASNSCAQRTVVHIV